MHIVCLLVTLCFIVGQANCSGDDQFICNMLVMSKGFDNGTGVNDLIGVIKSVSVNSQNITQYIVSLMTDKFQFKDVMMTRQNLIPWLITPDTGRHTSFHKLKEFKEDRDLFHIHLQKHITALCDLLKPQMPHRILDQMDENLILIILANIVKHFGVRGLQILVSYLKPGSMRATSIQFIDTFLAESCKFNKMHPTLAMTQSFPLKCGDIIQIKSLKSQNNDTLNERVKIVNNSIGIIMNNISRLNSKNQTEYLIHSLMNKQITIGLRRKYFKIIRKLYIHDISNCNLLDVKNLYDDILNDSNNMILYLSSENKEMFNPIYMSRQSRQNVINSSNLISSLSKCESAANRLNVKDRKQIINFLSKLPFICDQEFIADEAIFSMLISKENDNKRNRNIEKIKKVIDINYEKVIKMECCKNISIKKLQFEIEHNIQNGLSNLLNVNNRQNTKLWKDFVSLISHHCNQRIEELNRFKVFKNPRSDLMIISDVFEHYFTNTFVLHVITHNIKELNILEHWMRATLKYALNIDNDVVNMLLKRLIQRQCHFSISNFF